MQQEIKGSGNCLVFSGNVPPVELGVNVVNIKGSGNIIEFGVGVILNGFNILIESDNNFIKIGDGCRLSGKVVMKITNENCLELGTKTSVGGCNFIIGEGTSVIVGDECMLAWGLEIRSTDSHGIYDSSGLRVNPADDIKVGNRVWIGAQATILRGSQIPDDSVVGIRSVVSGKFDEKGVVIAGVPGRVVKRGIHWKRELLG